MAASDHGWTVLQDGVGWKCKTLQMKPHYPIAQEKDMTVETRVQRRAVGPYDGARKELMVSVHERWRVKVQERWARAQAIGQEKGDSLAGGRLHH